ncbi:hypothetical protein VTI74DRAFT_2017 [Chaetomium olivicolor]
MLEQRRTKVQICLLARRRCPHHITEPALSETITVTETFIAGGEPITLATMTTLMVPRDHRTTTATVTATVTAVPDLNIAISGDFEKATMEGGRVDQGPDVGIVEVGSNHALAFRHLGNFAYTKISTTVVGVIGTTDSCTFERAWEYQLGWLPERHLLPIGGVSVNGQARVAMFMRSGEAGVFKTRTFTFVSTGSHLLQFQAYSPQDAGAGLNEFYLDNVSCVPVQ